MTLKQLLISQYAGVLLSKFWMERVPPELARTVGSEFREDSTTNTRGNIGMTNPTYTINAAADVLERNRRAVARAVRNVEPDEIKAGQKRWRMATIFRGFQATYHQPQQGDKALSNARTRKAEAEADATERKNQIDSGKWCLIDDVAKIVGGDYLNVREHLLALPGAFVGPNLTDAQLLQCRSEMDAAIRDALNELSDPNYSFRKERRHEIEKKIEVTKKKIEKAGKDETDD